MKKRNPFSPVRTKHPGVYYLLGTDPIEKPRRTFYIQYYRGGKRHFEEVGHEGEIVGREAKAAHDSRWTIGKLAEEFPWI